MFRSAFENDNIRRTNAPVDAELERVQTALRSEEETEPSYDVEETRDQTELTEVRTVVERAEESLGRAMEGLDFLQGQYNIVRHALENEEYTDESRVAARTIVLQEAVTGTQEARAALESLSSVGDDDYALHKLAQEGIGAAFDKLTRGIRQYFHQAIVINTREVIDFFKSKESNLLHYQKRLIELRAKAVAMKGKISDSSYNYEEFVVPSAAFIQFFFKAGDELATDIMKSVKKDASYSRSILVDFVDNKIANVNKLAKLLPSLKVENEKDLDKLVDTIKSFSDYSKGIDPGIGLVVDKGVSKSDWSNEFNRLDLLDMAIIVEDNNKGVSFSGKYKNDMKLADASQIKAIHMSRFDSKFINALFNSWVALALRSISITSVLGNSMGIAKAAVSIIKSWAYEFEKVTPSDVIPLIDTALEYTDNALAYLNKLNEIKSVASSLDKAIDRTAEYADIENAAQVYRALSNVIKSEINGLTLPAMDEVSRCIKAARTLRYMARRMIITSKHQ